MHGRIVAGEGVRMWRLCEGEGGLRTIDYACAVRIRLDQKCIVLKLSVGFNKTLYFSWL